MVPEGSHVKSVYLTGSTGVLASSDLGTKILLDCSTIDVATVRAAWNGERLGTLTPRLRALPGGRTSQGDVS